jgi:hypothetical protein
MYQAVSAQAAAIHKMFVRTLGVSSGSCVVTRKPSSGHSTCPVVVIPGFADTIASIKKVLTACPKPGERPGIHAPHLSKADTPKISPTDEKVL